MISNYTVSDFYKTFEKQLKLVAGSGGMARVISNVGILDYEVDPVQKDKYFHTNFHENYFGIYEGNSCTLRYGRTFIPRF